MSEHGFFFHNLKYEFCQNWSSVTIWFFSLAMITVLELCCYLNFCVLLLLEFCPTLRTLFFLSVWVIKFESLILVAIWVFGFAQFELSFVSISVFDFLRNMVLSQLEFWVVSQFLFWFFSQFEFCHNLSFWVWPQFDFFSLVTIWFVKFFPI